MAVKGTGACGEEEFTSPEFMDHLALTGAATVLIIIINDVERER